MPIFDNAVRDSDNARNTKHEPGDELEKFRHEWHTELRNRGHPADSSHSSSRASRNDSPVGKAISNRNVTAANTGHLDVFEKVYMLRSIVNV